MSAEPTTPIATGGGPAPTGASAALVPPAPSAVASAKEAAVARATALTDRAKSASKAWTSGLTDTTGRVPVKTGPPERSLGQLVADASKDLSAIVRSEVALAKAELSVEAKIAAMGAALFAVAGVLALLGGLLLLFAIVYGLVALGLSTWLSFLIVAAVLLVLAGILALIGKSRLSKVGPPERTVRTAKETVETLKAAKPHAP